MAATIGLVLGDVEVLLEVAVGALVGEELASSDFGRLCLGFVMRDIGMVSLEMEVVDVGAGG